MKPWWPASPLRGKSRAEGRRLFRLMRSEERIDDRQDAESVRELMEYTRWYGDSVGGRFLERVGPWIAIPWWVLITAMFVSRGSWILALLSTLILAAYIGANRMNRSRRRQVRRTAQLNGWT